MNIKELLISIFQKEIGPLEYEHEKNYGDGSTYELSFRYKGKMTVRIVLIEPTSNQCFVYHDLSKENPFLLKKIVKACERTQRIKENKHTSLTLSEDLADIKKEMFIKTAVKSIIQNFFTTFFTLFGENQIVSPKIRQSHDEAPKHKKMTTHM